MARLVVLTHEFDMFAYREPSGRIISTYLLFDVLKQFEELGHRWTLAAGTKPQPGDAAIMHVDATRVGDEYLALADHYPVAINFGTSDVSKRKISSIQLAKGDDWAGQVVVKSNWNCGGLGEIKHNNIARSRNRPPPHPGLVRNSDYLLLDSIADVAEAAWDDPHLVVERYLPQLDEEGGFVICTYVFMGDRERCTRSVTDHWIAKADDAIRFAPMEIPEEIRAERERLCFDYGKFDFVMRDGRPILLDVNRTPGIAPALEPIIKTGARNLAEGLLALIKR